MTILASLIAAATAIFISIVVYPWQKHLDRANELARESRILYWRVLDAVGSTDKLYNTVLSRENDIDKLLLSAVSIGDLELAKKIDSLKVALAPWHEGRDKIRAGGLTFFKLLLRKESREISPEEVEELSRSVAEIIQLSNLRLTDSKVVAIPLRDWLRSYSRET